MATVFNQYLGFRPPESDSKFAFRITIPLALAAIASALVMVYLVLRMGST